MIRRIVALLRPASWLLLFTAVVLLPRSVRADSVTAEALFQSGREALDKGDFKIACDRFEESYRLEATPGTALNLGNCREQLGQVASAWQRFQEAAQTLPAGDPRIAVARERAALLQGKVPKLVLRVPAEADGWVVLRDGVVLGGASLNLALPVDPGPHEIEVRAPGRAPFRTTAQAELGKQSEVQLSAGEPRAAEASGAGAARADSGGSSRRTLGWVLGGVGVVGIATGLVSGGLVISKNSTVESECPDKRCSPAGLDAADAGRTLSTVSTIAFAAGAVSLGAGIYFLVSDDSSTARAQRLPVRRVARQTKLLVTSAPGALALQLRSSF